MQRNRDEHCIAIFSNERTHVAGHGAGDRDLAAVLQPDRETSREVAISHGGAGASDAQFEVEPFESDSDDDETP